MTENESGIGSNSKEKTVFTKKFVQVALAACALSVACGAHAATVTLDFEGLKDQEAVLGFYGGGAGSLGSVGTNYGITFADTAQAVIDSDAGGSGSVGNEPSPSTVLTFLRGSVILNVSQGFTDYFQFSYSTVAVTGIIKVFDGENGTGNLLATFDLANLGPVCSGDPTGQFCNWSEQTQFFSGVAKSIDFGGTANQIAFDNITFGNLTIPTGGGGGGGGTPVPEPMSLALVGAALFALSASRRRS